MSLKELVIHTHPTPSTTPTPIDPPTHLHLHLPPPGCRRLELVTIRHVRIVAAAAASTRCRVFLRKQKSGRGGA